MKYQNGAIPTLSLRAFVDLDGRIPAKIGDPVALILNHDLPFLVQPIVSSRPVLNGNFQVHPDHVLMTGDGVDYCMEFVGKVESGHE